ncbi:MAG: hypothetical protein ACOC9O_00165 [Myxococcota bacterium]
MTVGHDGGEGSSHDGADAGRGLPSGLFGAVSRRRWLLWALGAGTFLGGGGAGLLALRGTAPSVRGLSVLSDHQHRTLVALAETHLPRGGPFEDGATEHDVVRQVDGFLAGQGSDALRDLSHALLLFEYGPVIFGRRLATFSNLPADQRLAEWRSWVASDRLLQRQVALGFRKVLALVFFDQPPVWSHIGYPGPSLRGAAG